MPSDLEKQFDAAMMEIYRRARTEATYNAPRYLRMLGQHGGLETARILLHSTTVSEGYAALWERGRLDLTVEAMILGQSQWHQLFSAQELEIARRRLREYDYESV